MYCRFSRVRKTLRKMRRKLEWKTGGSYIKPSGWVSDFLNTDETTMKTATKTIEEMHGYGEESGGCDREADESVSSFEVVRRNICFYRINHSSLCRLGTLERRLLFIQHLDRERGTAAGHLSRPTNTANLTPQLFQKVTFQVQYTCMQFTCIYILLCSIWFSKSSHVLLHQYVILFPHLLTEELTHRMSSTVKSLIVVYFSSFLSI